MRKTFLICALAITAGCAKKQTPAPSVSSAIITTFAGNGSFGYSGDGGAATAAKLNGPINVATDNSGNVFIVDAGNYFIRKVNNTGIISTIAGTTSYTPGSGNGDGGAATNAIMIPITIAVDNSGNVYIVDGNYVSIRKVNTSGIITTIAGDGIQSDTTNNIPATAATFNNPYGVAADNSGNVYVSDIADFCIRKINSAGIINTIAGNGTGGYTGDGGPATAAEIVAYDLAADNNGNLYFSDGSSVVRKISASGIITTIAGNGQKGYSADGNAATASQLTEPYGIAVDNSGNVYISEKGNQRVRMVNTSGILHTIAGGGTGGLGDGHAATAAELLSPRGVAFDNSGNVFIADLGNNRVRKVSK